MTIQKGTELLQPFIDGCEKENDPFYIVHFSREEDKFNGFHKGLDSFDAAILVKRLIKDFGMSKMFVNSMFE